VRYAGDPLGLAGKVCYACFTGHHRDRRHAERVDRGSRPSRPLRGRDIRRAALAIRLEACGALAALCDRIENRRIRATERGPHLTPAQGASLARREYRMTFIGRALSAPPRGDRDGGR
jgi:hypothetical protein